MFEKWFKKGLVVVIIVLFIGMSITSSTGGIIKNIDKQNFSYKEKSSPTADWWPMYHHDPQHTGASTSTAPINNLYWKRTLIGDSSAPPSIVDNRIFWCCGIGDRDVLLCINAITGFKIWSFEPAHYFSSPSPAIVGGRVYIGSPDKNIYCLDATDGSVIWSYTTGNVVTTSPVVVNNKLYVISIHDKLYCLDAITGDFIWSFSNSYLTGSSPAVWDGKVYFGAFNGKVRCLDASDGSHIWTYSTLGEVDFPPTIANGRVYIGCYYQMYCLDANNGNLKWKYAPDYEDVLFGCPAVSNNRVYFNTISFYDEGKIFCLDATTGSFKWVFNDGMGSPVIADGKVFCGGDKLYCVDAVTGDLTWSYGAFDDYVGEPAIADGLLYVGTYWSDSKIYSFGKKKSIDTPFSWFLEKYPLFQKLWNVWSLNNL